jgi:hypothetical protein
LRVVPVVRVNAPTTIKYRVDYLENSSKYGEGKWETGPTNSYTFKAAVEEKLKPLDFHMGSSGEKRSGSVRLFVDDKDWMTVPYSFECRK